MPSVRQKKVSRVIKIAVSDAILNRLSDPRIQGLVTVTRTELTADLRQARVFLSVLGVDDKQAKLTLIGIQHAHGCIQSCLARALSMKVCPTLTFELDDSLKKTAALMKLIDEVLPHDGEASDGESVVEEAGADDAARGEQG